MPFRNRATLLLDLDGTLVDPAVGIISSCRYALEAVGRPIADTEDLSWIIGPPLRASFAQLLGGRGDPEQALRLYRERYAATGLYEATPYSGMIEVLAEKARGGAKLILCTAKPAIFARRVVEHFGFAPFLSAVYGPDLDGRFDDKGDLIEHLLAAEFLDPEQVCMVGDREHDVHAAARHGIPTVGVLWGFGSISELQGAGAELIIKAPSELIAGA